MCERMGPVAYADSGPMFLGRDLQQHYSLSDDSSKMIDEEVRKLLRECYQRAQEILKSHASALHQLAKRLIEKETVEGVEVEQILQDLAVDQ